MARSPRLEQAHDVFGTSPLLTAAGHNVDIQSNLQSMLHRSEMTFLNKYRAGEKHVPFSDHFFFSLFFLEPLQVLFLSGMALPHLSNKSVPSEIQVLKLNSQSHQKPTCYSRCPRASLDAGLQHRIDSTRVILVHAEVFGPLGFAAALRQGWRPRLGTFRFRQGSLCVLKGDHGDPTNGQMDKSTTG